MDSRFNSVQRKKRYRFTFDGGHFIEGVFHEILPDGCLMIGTESGKTCYLNPDNVQYVRAAD